MTGPSPHLSWAELACRDEASTPYPLRWRGDRALLLAAAFELVRVAVGRPLVIGSAYRTPAHNAAIGGARLSQHVEGRALDLYPPTGLPVATLYALARGVAKLAGLRGLGQYPNFVHIDVRPGARLVCWHGRRAWAEVP